MKMTKLAIVKYAFVGGSGLAIALTTLMADGQSAGGPPSTSHTAVPPHPSTPLDTGETITLPALRTFDSKYSVLLTRSLFLKGRPQQPNQIYTPRPNLGPTVEQIKFNGSSNDHGVWRAALEDLRSGTILVGMINDEIAQGTITNITLDKLEYTGPDGRQRSIAIGDNLAGTVASLRTAVLATPTTQSTAAGDAAGGDVLERLRQKRLAEQKSLLGGK